MSRPSPAGKGERAAELYRGCPAISLGGSNGTNATAYGHAACSGADTQLSSKATQRVQPAEAASILTGKQHTLKPNGGSTSRLASFSIWQ
jgi:hypothetical protein